MSDTYVYGNGYEHLMEMKMTTNTLYKSKSQIRAEGEDALAKFLKAGGTIEVVKAKKAPKSKMTCKSSRGFQGGTSGFATGFPRRSV